MNIDVQIILSVLRYRRPQMLEASRGSPTAERELAEKIASCLGGTPMLTLVSFERCKQIAKGYKAEHDDIHTLGQLTLGAVCYAQTAFTQINSAKPLPTGFKHKDWPWQASSFHAEEDPVGNLVKAAAMLIAEAERIERTRGAAPPTFADDMLLTPQIRPGIELAVKRDKIGVFLAAVSSYTASVLCDVKPERLEEALQDIEKVDAGQSEAMIEVQRAICAWVRAEMLLIGDPAYVDLVEEKGGPSKS